MDLETENRIAAILMKEAAELRRQAARDGVDAYLRPNIRGRPNSRFLTATVLGVQQSSSFSLMVYKTLFGLTKPKNQTANRAVEVNEMWRARQKEKEMEDRVKRSEKRDRSNGVSDSQKNTRFEDYERNHSSLCSSSKSPSEDGLRDKEIEEFLHSRAKRGRGAVGSRMDETGPYLPDSKGKSPYDMDYRESLDNRAILGPEKPRNLKSDSSSDEERERRGSKQHSRKYRSKEKSKDKKKKREKKRSKHHK